MGPSDIRSIGRLSKQLLQTEQLQLYPAFVLLQIVVLLRPRGDAYVGTRLYFLSATSYFKFYYTYFSPLFLFLNNLPNHASLT